MFLFLIYKFVIEKYKKGKKENNNGVENMDRVNLIYKLRGKLEKKVRPDLAAEIARRWSVL